MGRPSYITFSANVAATVRTKIHTHTHTAHPYNTKMSFLRKAEIDKLDRPL